MPDPTAVLQLRISGDAPVTGGVVGSVGDDVQMTADDKAGWGNPPTKWEIFSYPPGFGLPAGWSADVNGAYYYLGSLDPPAWTADRWGDYATRLTVLGRLVDESTRFRILSPSGLRDQAYGEDRQFGNARDGNVETMRQNLRILEGIVRSTFYRITSNGTTLVPDVINMISNVAAIGSVLPLASSYDGAVVVVKKHNIAPDHTVSRSGSDTIDGATTYVISLSNGTASFIADGTNARWLAFPPV